MGKQILLGMLLVFLLASSLTLSVFAEEEAFNDGGRKERLEKMLRAPENLLSGSVSTAMKLVDLAKGSSKAYKDFWASSEPVLQGAGAAALIPYRSPGPTFSRNILVTRDEGTIPVQTEPAIAVNPLDPENIVVAAIDYNLPNIAVYSSRDAGQTWEGPFQTRYLPEDLGSAGDPVVAFDRQGNLYLAFISLGFEDIAIGGESLSTFVSSIAVSKSSDGGRTWSEPVSAMRSRVTLNLHPPVDGVGGEITVGFLDKPWMTVGPDPQNPQKDLVYVSATHFKTSLTIVYPLPFFFGFVMPKTEATIDFAVSKDGGLTWSEPKAVSPVAIDTYKIDYPGIGVSDRVVQGSDIEVANDGTLYVSWMDSTIDGPFKKNGEIWVAMSNDAGQTFTSSLAASFQEPLGKGRSSPFRSWSNGFPKLSAGPDGSLSLVFGARGEDPMDDGDIFFVRSSDKAKSWSQPKKVNDDRGYTFQFFPEIDTDENGVIHVMFGDYRDSPLETAYHIYYTKSEDGGKTWLENTRVTDFPSNPNRGFPGGRFIGDYYGIVAVARDNFEDVYMVWSDSRLGEFGGFNQKIGFARQSAIKSPSIFLSPPSGTGGEDVIIKGYDFQPDTEIFIMVSGVLASTTRTNLEGRFSQRIFMPIASEGALDIQVFDASGNAAVVSFYEDSGFDTLTKALKEKEITIQGNVDLSSVEKRLDQLTDKVDKLFNQTSQTLVESKGSSSDGSMRAVLILGLMAMVLAIAIILVDKIKKRQPMS